MKMFCLGGVDYMGIWLYGHLSKLSELYMYTLKTRAFPSEISWKEERQILYVMCT